MVMVVLMGSRNERLATARRSGDYEPLEFKEFLEL
jgi:hypothetical protein